MEEHMFQLEPEELPSPEELFHTDSIIEEPVSVSRRKPIPRYRVVKRISIGFIIFLLVLIAGVFSLKYFGYHFYYMDSGSMESTIPKGSFLFEREVPAEDIRVGDIITYESNEGRSVTHEVIKVISDYDGTGSPAFRTRGTENNHGDREAVTSDMIQGRVIFYIPYLGGILAKLNPVS